MFTWTRLFYRICPRSVNNPSHQSTCWVSSRAFDLPSVGTEPVTPPLSSYEHTPIIAGRVLEKSVYCSNHLSERLPRQAWVETLKPNYKSAVGLIDLHPDVFAVFPRLDLVHKNLYWQAHYRMVDWRCITTRAELSYRSNRKPWPQKGTGRARHGNRRTHLWMGGGQCKGPRGPESYFSMLPREVRIAGLLTMLSVKHAQNDLHIVDDVSLSNELEVEAQQVLKDYLEVDVDPEDLTDPLSAINRKRAYHLSKTMNDAAIYVRQLIDDRLWGPSVLFVTKDSPNIHLNLPTPSQSQKAVDEEIDWTNPPSLAISLACASYANHIEAEISPEASIHSFESIAPRVTHPGRGLTVMPLHGLNVWSLVHHDTVVLTLDCLDLLENRLLTAQRTLVRDASLERMTDGCVKRSPVDWLSSVEYEEMQRDDSRKWPSGGHRHISGTIDSPYWQRLRLS